MRFSVKIEKCRQKYPGHTKIEITFVGIILQVCENLTFYLLKPQILLPIIQTM